MQRAAFLVGARRVKYACSIMSLRTARRQRPRSVNEWWHGLPWNGIFWLWVVAMMGPAVFFGVKAELDLERLLGIQPEALARLESGDGATAVMILNGDEFVIEHDKLRARVRMLGIKSFDPVVNEREVTAYGDASVQFLKQWILNKEIRLFFDDPKQDEHGRYLAFVYLGDIDINQLMVAEGVAMAYTQYETAREREYLMAEIHPRQTGVGIWGGSKAVTRINGLRREWSNERVARNGQAPFDPLLDNTP